MINVREHHLQRVLLFKDSSRLLGLAFGSGVRVWSSGSVWGAAIVLVLEVIVLGSPFAVRSSPFEVRDSEFSIQYSVF